jgi:prepilin-type N-terminal cleavage/methylation domain-containing protein/prepilin-type processing-associated H-X9-DG protein
MKRLRRQAFTLVELLVVVAIIAVLVALLVTGTTTAVTAYEATRCQTNLATLYKAHVLWLADRDVSSGRMDGGWGASIQPYIERSAALLKCPSCPWLAEGIGAGSSSGTTGLEGAADTGHSGVGESEDPVVELQEVTIGVTNASGALLYEIPLTDSPYWGMFQTYVLPSGLTRIGCNTDGHKGQDSSGRNSDEDFKFDVQYKNGQLAKVTYVGGDGNSHVNHGRAGPPYLYTDFRIAHEPIWGGQRFSGQFGKGHEGEVIDIPEEARKAAARKRPGKSRKAVTTWTAWAEAPATLSTTNYGISRGAYQNNNGQEVVKPDPRAFFILDYPRPVADYTGIGGPVADGPFWQNIFISPAPPDTWDPPPGMEGRTWQCVQALRHFGKANVLFCDGHIAALGPEELDVTNPGWRYGGR